MCRVRHCSLTERLPQSSPGKLQKQFSLQFLTAHQSQNTPSAVPNSHLGLSLEEGECWIWSKTQESLTNLCTDRCWCEGIVYIEYCTQGGGCRYATSRVTDIRKKTWQNSKSPKFLLQCCSLEEISNSIIWVLQLQNRVCKSCCIQIRHLHIFDQVL